MIILKRGGKVYAKLTDRLKWEAEDPEVEQALNDVAESLERHPMNGDPALFIANQANHRLELGCIVINENPPKAGRKVLF